MTPVAHFSIRRLMTSVTLIALGCFEVAHVTSLRPPPLTAIDLFAVATFLPVLGAGVLTPFHKTVLGLVIGVLAFPVYLLWLFWRVGGAY